VGQLISRKRVVETVELLAQVAKERPIHLLVAGTGPLESEMRTCAKNHNFTSITFCGYTKPERLSQLYVSSDGLILLSEDEPWGMVVNESVIFGKKFIATDSVAAAVEFKKIRPSLGFFLNTVERDGFLTIKQAIVEETQEEKFSSEILPSPETMKSLFIDAMKLL